MENTQQTQELAEDQLNEVKTKELKESQNIQTFLNWCSENKVLMHKGIGVPAAFGPLGVPGVVALEDIPANTVIAAIPDKLMISQHKILNGELKEMLQDQKNGELFQEKIAGDAEFNIITAFLIYEKGKGENSFYKPYFDTIERSYTLYDWDENDVKETQCPELISEFKHYKEDAQVTWIQLKNCLEQYPQFYVKEQLTDELFYWCYELVMTRVFGHSLPYTCLVPFGDLFNHGNHSATHYIVNNLFESLEKEAHPKYKIKKNKIDLGIFDTDNQGKFKSSNNDFHFRCKRYRFVKDHFKVLPKNLREKFEQNTSKYLEDDILREMIYEINTKEITLNKEVNIWDLKFFTTSATEDNDTDEDQTEQRKKEYDNLFHKEIKIIEKNSKKQESNSKLLKDKSQNGDESSDSEFQANDYESGDESSYEEEEEEEKQSEEEQKQNLDSSQNKKTLEQKEFYADEKTDKFNDNQLVNDKEITDLSQEQSKVTTKENQSEEIKVVKQKKEVTDNKSVYEYHLDSVSTLSDDSEFPWYDAYKENTYFAVTTEQPYKKGQQIFLCYGRRTNKFLLQWYGFTFQNNLYDSFGFRMWIKPEPHPLQKPGIFDQIVFRSYISEEDWKAGFVMNKEYKIKTVDLTKEFRLKRGHLCEEFIIYLRIYLSSHYDGDDQSKLLFTIPHSIRFEMYVFEFAKEVLMYMKNQYTTKNEDDEALLKDYNISYKLRFATVLRLEHKKLLDEQIKIIESIIKILTALQKQQIKFQNKHKESQLEEQFSLDNKESQLELQFSLDNKENQEIRITTNQSSLSEKSSNQSSEIKQKVFTDKDLVSLKDIYLQNVESFDSKSNLLLIERHKIKKYLEKLHIVLSKQKTL